MKTFFSYFAVALIISATGMLMVDFGGWDAQGPTSSLAFVGGLLNYYHVLFWTMIFGNFAPQRPILDFFIMLLIPALHWSMFLFVGKTVSSALWTCLSQATASLHKGAGASTKKGKKK